MAERCIVDEGPLLEVRGLRKAFGQVQAVAGVSFRLRPGERCALIGPNGAGKSTLMHLLAGQLRADEGSVSFRGAPIAGLAAHRISRRGMGRTFQVTAVFGSLTAAENVLVALLSHRQESRSLSRVAVARLRGAALAHLADVGLGDRGDAVCSTLPFGDLKRVELAVALAGEPVLLLLDEPTAGLAPGERLELMELVGRLVGERGLSVLFTEHDMDVVFATAERILVMHEGELIAEGPPAAVRADPRVQAIYLGEQP
jgi:branched-chain amino acid transport system ATP-binding protein